MIKKMFKVMMVCLMLVGMAFTVVNFLTVKSEAITIHMSLEAAIDPVEGNHYLRCFGSGQTCTIVIPIERP